MARYRYRTCLEQGLKLDLNYLVRKKFVRPGEWVGELKISWDLGTGDKEPSRGLLTSNMEDSDGYLRLQIGKIDQGIKLVAQKRHFGGQQWYFICPVSQRRCSVVWRPSGASRFASSHAWKREAAYASQFQTRTDRAISAARRIRMQLGGASYENICTSDPPKPKGMRWRTYRKLIDRSHHHRDIAMVWLAKRVVNLDIERPTDQ